MQAEKDGKGGAGMFYGRHRHTLDAKGRIIIPACYREDLGSGFLLMRGDEECLLVYPGSELEKFSAKFAELPSTDRSAQAYIRMFLSGMSRCDFDNQGRILIPADLREYAGLEKEAVVIGAYNRVEIWSRDKWEAYTAASRENDNAILNDMTRFGI